MKKRDWTIIKTILFSYLAISKMIYWVEVIAYTDSLAGVGSAVFERFVYRDIMIILLLACIYYFEHLVILKQKKWNNLMSQIIVILFGLVMFICIYTVYFTILYFVIVGNVNFMGILSNIVPLSTGYLILAAFLFIKEQFKEKEARAYAVDIQTVDVKLEVLKALLDDGVLTEEEFDRQKGKL